MTNFLRAGVSGKGLHNADDAMEVKIWIPQHDVEFRQCTVWNDLGGSFGLMSECNATSHNIAFHDCTVIHSTDNASVCPVVGINLQGPGAASGYSFRNILVEQLLGLRRPAVKVFNNWNGWAIGNQLDPANPYRQAGSVPHQPARGTIADVLFENINVLQAADWDVVVMGDGPSATIKGVTFTNVSINGRRIVPGDARLKCNQWVSEIRVGQ